MMSETPPISAPPTETVATDHGSNSVVGTMSWNQPGFAGLWGLATTKDSLKYWLRRKSFNSFILTRWVFAGLLVVAALNGYLILTIIFSAGEVASYSTIAALVLLLVLGTTKERSQGIYFWSAWGFWICMSLLGFVNATNVSADNFRVVMQTLVKSWITLIGFPWMAFRIISPDKLPKYTKLLVLTATVGSFICLLQTAYPALFSLIRNFETSRGTGTWDNANSAAFVLMMALLLRRLVDWRSRGLKWAVFLILLAGFIGTFSRGALLGFIAGEMVYLVIVRDYKKMLLAGSFLVLFISSWAVIGFLVQNNTITVVTKEMRMRLQTVSNVLSGKASEDLEAGRLIIWRASIQEVLDEGGLLFGVGHIGMIKSKSLGLATHNDYIQFFANGGLAGLALYLGFLSMLAFISWRCKDRLIRAILLSILASYAVFSMTGNNLLMLPMTGPYFAIFVLWAHYSWEYPGAEKVLRLRKSLARNMAMSNTSLAMPR